MDEQQVLAAFAAAFRSAGDGPRVTLTYNEHEGTLTFGVLEAQPPADMSWEALPAPYEHWSLEMNFAYATGFAAALKEITGEKGWTVESIKARLAQPPVTHAPDDPNVDCAAAYWRGREEAMAPERDAIIAEVFRALGFDATTIEVGQVEFHRRLSEADRYAQGVCDGQDYVLAELGWGGMTIEQAKEERAKWVVENAYLPATEGV